MVTIIEYTDRKAPQNLYPVRIISPTSAGPCCYADMEEIGASGRTARWVFQYRRCRHCGFTVRVIVRPILHEAALTALRKILAKSFLRKAPNF